MVESIYFLKPAWCEAHPAGLRPEEGLQSSSGATAFRQWFSVRRISNCRLWVSASSIYVSSCYQNTR
jgi:hypothetical protein